MASPIISIEHIGKRYRIGRQRGAAQYLSLRDAISSKARAWFRRKPSEPGDVVTHEDFWALNDISFDVNHGEAVGIVGRNGAGKSTLLKILSRITEPTRGKVTLRGRVASLLEVGTGFHPELTGRENVYLNGTILGMTRQEIRQKFDAIVQFAEVEKFLDTPVKRYSSGMYVRLAFAVAAHLNPEILIVDEVLAVGDAAFQKKCLGKMSEVAHEGRTVLFVSHNISAIKNLTNRVVLLESGKLAFVGSTEAGISRYINSLANQTSEQSPTSRGVHTRILAARLVDHDGLPTVSYESGTPLRVQVTFETDGTKRMSLELFLLSPYGDKLAISSLYQLYGISLPEEAGTYTTILEYKPLWLASGSYYLDVATSVVNSSWDHYLSNFIPMEALYYRMQSQPWDFRADMEHGHFALETSRLPEFHLHPS